MTRRGGGGTWMLGVAAWLAAFGCGKEPSLEAGAEAGAGGGFGTIVEASAPVPRGADCESAVCVDPVGGGPLVELACCLPSGGCGLEARSLASGCLPPNGKGSVDGACPSAWLTDGTELQGCCTPEDRCGVFDRLGDLGCIPRVAAGGDAGGPACRYSPSATCRSVVEMPCDGREDCASGEACCARSSHGTHDAFGCFASCAAHGREKKEVWVEVCHPGDACGMPGTACLREGDPAGLLAVCRPPLPPPDAGPSEAGTDAAPNAPSPREASAPWPDANPEDQAGVRCGSVRCGGSEKCCLGDPAPPYCTPSSLPCTCEPHLTDGGRRTPDAG